jgi:hypothetical protein
MIQKSRREIRLDILLPQVMTMQLDDVSHDIALRLRRKSEASLTATTELFSVFASVP